MYEEKKSASSKAIMTETEQVMVKQMYIHSAKLPRMTLKRVVPK